MSTKRVLGVVGSLGFTENGDVCYMEVDLRQTGGGWLVRAPVAETYAGSKVLGGGGRDVCWA